MSQQNKDIKNIWGWLNEITLYKTPVHEISEESWNNFNYYMIHRYVSMDMKYIDVVNYIQKINPQSKKQIYSIYREMIPKKKTYLKYIKNENKRNYQELAEYVAEYLECSLGEADQYIDILQDTGVRSILWKMGIDDDETEKLIKKANAKLLGFASIIDRSTKKSLKIKTGITSHLKIEVPTYDKKQLPQDLKSIPITTPGSRFIK